MSITRRTFLGTTILSSFMAMACLAVAAPGDWPQWRGPNRDAISKETGLLQTWPEGGPKMLWKATGLGAGHSTVSIVGDRIYTTGDRGETSYAIALNLADGKQVWESKLGKAGAPGWGGFAGPRATPTVDGELLFAVGQWGDFVCLDRATGTEKWRKDYSKDFGAPRPEWGFSESPLVDGEQVIVTPGGDQGAIVALDKKSGKLLWRTKDFTDPAHYSSLIIAEIEGVRQYIQLTERSLVGVAAADGKLLWRAPRKGATAVIPDPVYHDGHVYVTSGYGIGCHLFKISASGGSFTAEQVYGNKVMVNHHGGVIRIGENLYGHSDNKGWTCQDFKTGEAKWQEKGKIGKGSVVFADGRLYLRQEDKQGTIALIEATPTGYVERGRFEQPDRSSKNSWAHPVVAGGKLYIRDQDILLCYDVKAK